MAKHSELFAVSKNGEFFGYADAGQIAASGGKLELFDENSAKAARAQAEIDAAKARLEGENQKVADVKKVGGADASAVKKAPSA